MLNLLKTKFLSIISLNIFKNLKRRNLLNFFRKKKVNNKIFFSRNFYNLKRILPNMYLKERFKKLKKKLRKRHNFKLIKKLKKFNYISGRSNLTRQQVYRRFKGKIIKRLKRKSFLKKKHFYLKSDKYRFNLFIYNMRNGYKNRMKAKELKLLISPKYFYSNKKASDYRDIQKLEKGLNWNELPDNVMTKFRKNWKKEDTLTTDNFYLYADKKINDLIFFKNYREWKRRHVNSKYTFQQYKKFIIKKKKKEKIRKAKNIFSGFNAQFNINKHVLWVFQKMFIFFKNTNIIKKNKYSNLFLNYYYKYKIIYNNLINIIINVFKMYVLRYLYKNQKKWFFYLKKIRKILTLLKIIIQHSIINKKIGIVNHLRKNKQKKEKDKEKEKEIKKEIKEPIIEKKDTGFLSIYNNEYLNSIENWQKIVNSVPWMTFKDKRIFDKKNKFYLTLLFDQREKKKFLDWVYKTEIRIKNARLSYKNKKYEN